MTRIRNLACLTLAFGLTACASNPPPAAPKEKAETKAPAPEKITLASGLDRAGFDTSIRAQDDLYQHVNGTWLKETEIPADKSDYSMFTRLADEARENIKAIVEEIAANEHPAGSTEQKIADFYRSYLDEAKANELGLEPLKEDLARIRKLRTKKDVIREMGRQQQTSLSPLLASWVDQDAKNATEYILYFHQAGLGLPDRDYYLKKDEKMEATRKAYLAYVEKVFTLAGRKDAKKAAKKVWDLELQLAKVHWARAETRDREKAYNKHDLKGLKKLAPAMDWPVYFEGMGVKAPAAVIVRQPTYVTAAGKLLRKVPVATWKTYLEWNLLNGFAPLLSKDFVDAHFAFYGTTISGIQENEERWKRAINALDRTLGEAVGKAYVERHFRPEAKARMEELVANLRRAFGEGIDGLTWMSDETKVQAKAKLERFVTKIGYPDQWRDYSKLEIVAGDLVGNAKRARMFEHERNLNKLGKPIDRTEWFMTPQTVNAYYNPPMNEIVFPAAILQPPFFDMEADDAVNYGAIGAVIGHELSHGFDDQGRKSDGDGNLRDWWTKEDAEKFTARAEKMVSQYAAFEPLPGQKVNGKLTLGENIGDLGGLTIAYRAYQLSLDGKEAPEIDGTTGSQRFFMGWAQVWRRKYRDQELQRRLLTDPHSPAEYRVLGVVANMPEFYEAFDVKEGDELFLPEDQRVKIW